jgi:hypothetical protein
MCTVINQPGASTCHICFTPAPQTAFVDVAAEKAKRDAEEKRQKEEAERIEQEKRREEERRAQEEQERLEQEKHQKRVEDEFERTQRFLGQSRVLGCFFGSVRGGKSARPLLVGAAMHNREECVLDVHVKHLSYRKQYLDNFMSLGAVPGPVENRLTKEHYATEAACLDSLLANNQMLLESLYPAVGPDWADSGANSVLRGTDVGVIRLPLEEVSVLCQIGEDVAAGMPLLVLV